MLDNPPVWYSCYLDCPSTGSIYYDRTCYQKIRESYTFRYLFVASIHISGAVQKKKKKILNIKVCEFFLKNELGCWLFIHCFIDQEKKTKIQEDAIRPLFHSPRSLKISHFEVFIKYFPNFLYFQLSMDKIFTNVNLTKNFIDGGLWKFQINILERCNKQLFFGRVVQVLDS